MPSHSWPKQSRAQRRDLTGDGTDGYHAYGYVYIAHGHTWERGDEDDNDGDAAA